MTTPDTQTLIDEVAAIGARTEDLSHRILRAMHDGQTPKAELDALEMEFDAQAKLADRLVDRAADVTARGA